MTSKIGKLSNLTLQDTSHNPLPRICDQNTSEAQTHIASTIDQLLQNDTFKDFFTGLIPSVTQSPFQINITEEEVTITDDKGTEHSLKFADVTDESKRQGLIGQSKALLEKINSLYQKCHHTCETSAAIIDPSRVTPLHTVAGVGAQSQPTETSNSPAQGLNSKSQSDLRRITQDLDLLQAGLHARELRQAIVESCIQPTSTLSQQEFTDIAANHPRLPRNQKLDDLVANMGIRRADCSREQATLLSSTHIHVNMPFRPAQPLQKQPHSAAQSLPTATLSEAESLEQRRLALVEQNDRMAIKYSIGRSSTQSGPARQEESVPMPHPQTPTPSRTLTAAPESPFAAASLRIQIPLNNYLDSSPTPTPLVKPQRRSALQPAEAILTLQPEKVAPITQSQPSFTTAISAIELFAVKNLIRDLPDLTEEEIIRELGYFTSNQRIVFEELRIQEETSKELSEYPRLILNKQPETSPRLAFAPMLVQGRKQPAPQAQTPTPSRTLTAPSETQVAVPLPRVRKPCLVERKVHSIHEINKAKPLQQTAAEKLIQRQAIEKELEKKAKAGRNAEIRARQRTLKRSYQK